MITRFATGSRDMSINRAMLLAAMFSAALSCHAVAGPVYFLVSEIPGQAEHGDSFVLPLETEADIAHARDLVLRGPQAAGAPLVFADIVAGADNINRDILAPGKPAWSWHISNFGGFGDGGIELVDGWPTYIEQDVEAWINNTGGGTVDNDGDGVPDGNATTGKIGFWNYTVTKELIGPPTDLSVAQSVVVPSPTGLSAGTFLLVACGALSIVARRCGIRLR